MAAKGWFSPERNALQVSGQDWRGDLTDRRSYHDIRNVISKRFPAEIILHQPWHRVQAHEDIARAIVRVQEMVDVLIVGRAGVMKTSCI